MNGCMDEGMAERRYDRLLPPCYGAATKAAKDGMNEGIVNG